ncbi:hypothetical protein Tco_0731782 [Tanacetum coccineum]
MIMNAEIQSMMDNIGMGPGRFPPGCKTVGAGAAYYDYENMAMDVKTAFFKCLLDDDIYIVQPDGFVVPNHPRNWIGNELQQSTMNVCLPDRILNTTLRRGKLPLEAVSFG